MADEIATEIVSGDYADFEIIAELDAPTDREKRIVDEVG